MTTATRTFVCLLFITLSAAIASADNEAKRNAGQPNVVILLTDDQGTLDANCYGSTDLATPNIDKLAATGIRFTQAYVAHRLLSLPSCSHDGASSAARRSSPLDSRRHERAGWHQHGD